jgi:hypothetical protein
MLKELKRRREDAERRCDEAGAEIPIAILNGDEGKVAELRSERLDAAMEADEVTDAMEAFAEAERAALKEVEAARRRVEREAARELAEARMQAAANVDVALAELESAVLEHRDLGLELSRVLRTAGIADDRIECPLSTRKRSW